MKKFYFTTTLLFCLLQIQSRSMTNFSSLDSLYPISLEAKNESLWLGVSLITFGLTLEATNAKQNFQTAIINKYGINRSKIDDYTQHIPIILLYGNQFFSNPKTVTTTSITKQLIVAEGLSLSSMLILKYLSNKKRPNGGKFSFPSGHTSYAFASATLLYLNLKEHKPLLAYSGFLIAGMTGTFRVIKNKHWVSDVLFGAGLGMLSSFLSFQFDLFNCKGIATDNNSFNPLYLSVSDNGLVVKLSF